VQHAHICMSCVFKYVCMCVNKYARYMYMRACAIVCVRGHVLYVCNRLCMCA
jgi:hypothetical protein